MGRHDKGAVGAAGRPGHRRSHHHLRPGAGGGLYDAIHESGHFRAVPKTGKATAQSVLLPVPALAGRVDLHGNGLSRRFRPAVYPGAVSPIFVAIPLGLFAARTL